MSIQTLPFVSVQADWDQVVREVASDTVESASFWIACYLTGTKTLTRNPPLNAPLLGRESVQGSVEVTQAEDSKVNLEGKDGITVTVINSVRRIHRSSFV